MATFKKYNSIENSYRQKFLNYIVEQGKADGEWTVTEKVHGSNFSFVVGEHEMKCAKRSGFIAKDEAFFDYERIVEKYGDSVKAIAEHLKATREGIETVTVFGEIFGGNYPHPDVENDREISAVQKEVHYCPAIDFYAFDIMVNGEDYLSVDEANELFEKFNLFYAKTLFRGTLEECLAFEKEYVTTIPALLGLPTIEGNIGEGNVIKPVEPRFLFSGSRVIIKNKTAKFSEKKNKTPKVKKALKLSPEAERLLGEMSALVTENRLRNVLSHIGEVTQKDFGKIMGEVNKDVIEDFMKDFKEEFVELDKKERQAITKDVGRQNAELLRKNFLNIIDGLF
jgi:Rnl2 family RNA ligase